MSQPNRKPAASDWKRAKREAAQDAPIAHTATDSPYYPDHEVTIHLT